MQNAHVTLYNIIELKNIHIFSASNMKWAPFWSTIFFEIMHKNSVSSPQETHWKPNTRKSWLKLLWGGGERRLSQETPKCNVFTKSKKILSVKSGGVCVYIVTPSLTETQKDLEYI